MAIACLQRHHITKFSPSCSPLRHFVKHLASSSPPPSFAKVTTFSHAFQHCSQHREADAGRAAHARVITSGFVPTTFVANCLLHMYIRCSNLEYASQVFDRMPQKDIVSWNAMITGYAQEGLVDVAISIFDAMPDRDVISWNSLISGFSQNGQFYESLDLLLWMIRYGTDPDHTTFAVTLKSVATLEELEMGIQIHGLIVKKGLDFDVVIGSALVDMYAKCKSLDDSIRFFDKMPGRNLITWSAVIGGCIQNEEFIVGLELFLDMQRCSVGVSQSAYASIFRSCAGLASIQIGRQLHAHALKFSFSSDSVVGTSILDMYAKNDCLNDARKVFQRLPTRTLQSWNAIVVGYVRNNQGYKALELFKLMIRSNIDFDEISLSGVFSACAEVKGYLQGLQIHGLAIKTSLINIICVNNALLDMYGKCKALTEASNIFKDMKQRDAVSWNAMITALEQNEQYENTLLHFYNMLSCRMKPDEFTYGSVLKACAGLQSLEYGVNIHGKIIKSNLGLDSFVGSALVDMYCKCGTMEEAQKLHLRIQDKTLVSSNAIISGFSLQKQSNEAQNFFSQMLDNGLEPDHFTYATVLDTCANLATVGLGKQIHAQIVKRELQKDIFVSSTLVDMYAKCGNMNDSLLMFNKMKERDVVSWNALIYGYANHGLGLEALRMFDRMQSDHVMPNHATFIAFLRACGHVGLFDEAIFYFNLMTSFYNLEPQLEHYSCMVDIIGRSKGIDEALKLIKDMPFEADAVIWRNLLSVCKIHGNVEVAEIAADNLLMLDPEDSSAYVLLTNIYADVGKWREVSKMRRMMKESKLKKEPGCSWIEVKNEMHAFLAGDKAHPKCCQIYERLNELIDEMMRSGYAPDMGLFIEEDDKEGIEDLQEQVETGSG